MEPISNQTASILESPPESIALSYSQEAAIPPALPKSNLWPPEIKAHYLQLYRHRIRDPSHNDDILAFVQ